jgi:putative DNA primase/helicase
MRLAPTDLMDPTDAPTTTDPTGFPAVPAEVTADPAPATADPPTTPATVAEVASTLVPTTADTPAAAEETGGPVPDDVVAAVRRYRELGVAVARIRAGAKQPTSAGWTERSAEPDEFRPGDNVGLLCGWLSDGREPGRFLVCVDLDSADAVAKAGEFLPPTDAVEGRASKPRSHWWYFVTDVPAEATSHAEAAAAAAKRAGKHPGPAKRQFGRPSGPWSGNGQVASTPTAEGQADSPTSRPRSGNKKRRMDTVLDFVGTGGQAVVPPSRHEKGEVRTWDPGHGVEHAAVVPFDTLWAAVRRLAEACGHPPKPGGKPKQANAKQPPAAPATRSLSMVTDGAVCTSGSTNPAPSAVPGQVQGTCTRDDVPMDERVRLCREHLKTAELARSGSGGHATTYRIAREIVNDYAVTDRGQALDLLKGYNTRLKEAGEEEWTDAELEHKLDSALAAPPDPRFPVGRRLPGGVGEWGNPAPLADRFVAGRPPLYWSGHHYRFNGKHYDEVDPRELQAEVWSFLEREASRCPPPPPKVHRSLRDNVVAAIEARGAERVAGRGHRVRPNAWLPGTGDGGDVLVVANGLLDVSTRQLRPHTPDFFALYALPYDYDPAAVCPTWEAAVARIAGGDAELVRLLRQWFGYCLTTGTDEQKFVVLVGDGGNGKSTLIGGLLAVVGEANASHVPLERFGEPHDLGYTLGKLVNVPDDMAEVDRAAEGVLKTYTAGGAMAFNQKHRAILHARPTAKLMFATNAVPRFTDRSSGLWRRLLLVPLTATFPAGERVRGMDKPAYWERAGELPGMLNWALDGLADLRAGDGFVLPACVEAAVAEHRLDSNPARAFVTEHLKADPSASVPSRDVYSGYTRWAKEHGHLQLGHSQYTREVRRVYPGVERDTERDPGDRNVTRKVLRGIAWAEGSEYAPPPRV